MEKIRCRKCGDSTSKAVKILNRDMDNFIEICPKCFNVISEKENDNKCKNESENKINKIQKSSVKKTYFTVGDLLNSLAGLNKDLNVYVRNSFNPVGNISELAEVKLDVYSYFFDLHQCVILDTSMNVDLDEE